MRLHAVDQRAVAVAVVGSGWLLEFNAQPTGTGLFLNPSLLLSWMFEHDCLDTYCFGCLLGMCFVFLYSHLFSAIEHVSHGKAL